MAKESMIIVAVVVVLGLLSVGAGFAADVTRVKASQIRIIDGKCVHPSNPVMGLAITAAVAMFLLRVIVRVATGRGYGCCRTHPSVPKLIRYCIIAAWVMSAGAVGTFIAGAKLCNNKDLQGSLLTGYSCKVVKPGLFSSAATAALISLCLTLFYYLVIASAQKAPKNPSAASEVVVEAPPVANDHLTPPVTPQM